MSGLGWAAPLLDAVLACCPLVGACTHRRHAVGLPFSLSPTCPAATRPPPHLTCSWGNMGAGLTHLIMPYILTGIANTQPDFIAWRVAYFIPAFCQIIIGLAVLIFGQDLPDGEWLKTNNA